MIVLLQERNAKILSSKIKEYSSNKYVLQVFYVSIFSSFYILLSSLDILKNNKFFGGSVVFRSFVVEHRIRCVISTVLSIASIGLFGGSLIEPQTKAIIGVFTGFYVVFLIVNILTLRRIGRFNAN